MNVKLATLCIALSLMAGTALAEPAGPGSYQDASGPKDSGECANWSDWYTLTTRPIAAGHTITNFSYHLEGDRQCGAWANCEVTTNSATQKAVRFQLQGHSEDCGLFGHNNGSRRSEMVFTYSVQ